MKQYEMTKKKTNMKTDVRVLAQIGVLSCLAFILMMLEFPLWFAPGFYQLDFSELPVLIGAFAMGPLAGVTIELIKVTLYFFLHGSSTMGVGDLANFVIGCAFVIPAAVMYKHHKSRKNALIGMSIGTLAMVLVSSVVNAFVLLPLYVTAFHIPMSTMIEMGSTVNPSITGLRTFILLAVVPFNVVKGIVISLLTMLLYKKVSPLLHNRIR